MYIEISARRTGKTARLLQAAIHARREGKFIGLMARNASEMWDLTEQVGGPGPDLIYTTHAEDFFKPGAPHVEVFFVDDFDFIPPSRFRPLLWRVDLARLGFYTTTPARIRSLNFDNNTMATDPLMVLLFFNDLQYYQCDPTTGDLELKNVLNLHNTTPNSAPGDQNPGEMPAIIE